jgi:hypothetical protein
MLRTLILCAAASVAIGLAHPTFAQGQFGTAAEAKAMLEAYCRGLRSLRWHKQMGPGQALPLG